MTDKSYNQAEVDELVRRAVKETVKEQDQLAFEAKTRRILEDINVRLDEANNYKATIGRDVRELKDEMLALRMAREGAVNEEVRQHAWWQDTFIRIGIVTASLWYVISFLQATGLVPHFGK